MRVLSVMPSNLAMHFFLTPMNRNSLPYSQCRRVFKKNGYRTGPRFRRKRQILAVWNSSPLEKRIEIACSIGTLLGYYGNMWLGDSVCGDCRCGSYDSRGRGSSLLCCDGRVWGIRFKGLNFLWWYSQGTHVKWDYFFLFLFYFLRKWTVLN